jgi:hypothetical protein
MAVHLGMEWLATRWSGQGRTVQHHDLVRVPNGHGSHYYGIFSQPEGDGGIWKECLSEAEARERLQNWAHEEPTPTRRAQSQITAAGRRWLES